MNVSFVIEHTNQDDLDPTWQWVLVVDGERVAVGWGVHDSLDGALDAISLLRAVAKNELTALAP